MEKKSFLGILFILLILFLYPYYLKFFSSPKKEEKIIKITKTNPPEISKAQSFEIKELKNYDTVHDTVLQNRYLRLKCSNQGAGISMIQLIRLKGREKGKDIIIYKSNNYDANLLFFAEPFLNYELNRSLYNYEEGENEVKYSLIIPEQFILEKVLSLEKDSYFLHFTLRIKNLDKEKPLPFTLNFLGLQNVKTNEAWEERFWEIVYFSQGNIKRDFYNKIKEIKTYFSPISWLALKNKYTCQIVIPSSQNTSFLVKRTLPHCWKVYAQAPLYILQPGEIKEEKFIFYLGPLDISCLGEYNRNWKEIIYFGMFDSIAKLILRVLKISYLLFKNYGLAIIFLSLLVNFILFPITLKNLKSMQALQKLQPRIEELRKQYKNDPQNLNKEIIELYRKNKVNPFGGCLPLFLQMPIFVALYQVLSRAIELKGEKFLWIKDLSLPDAFIIFPKKILFLETLNLLPIIMIFAMYLQQRRMQPISATSSPQSNWFMPLLLGLIFYSFPSGLVLYWLISTFFNLVFQTKFPKR